MFTQVMKENPFSNVGKSLLILFDDLFNSKDNLFLNPLK